MARDERCARCRVNIIWARTPNGTAIPLDYRVDDEATTFALVSGDVAIEVSVVGRFDMKQAGRRLYTPHTHYCKPAERRSA
jgi:hypothetical protein